MIDPAERELAALDDKLNRVQKQLDKLEDNEARKVAKAIAEGRTENEIDRIRRAFDPELNKLSRMRDRLLYRISDYEARGYELSRRR